MDDLTPEGYYDAVAVPTTDDEGVIAYARLAFTGSGVSQVVADFSLLNLPAGITPPKWPVRWYGFFTDETFRRTCESLRAMGFQGNDFMTLDNQELNQIVRVKVEHNHWNGKTSLRVAFVNAPGGGTVKLNNAMSVDEKRKFAAKMKASMASTKESYGPRLSPAETPASAPVETNPVPFDDDSPF